VHRLTGEQRQLLFGYWRTRGAVDPQVLTRATRGGPLRAWGPLGARLLWGCETESLRTARYVFSGHRYRQLMEALPRGEVALVGMRVAQLRYAKRTGIPAQSLFDARRALALNFPRMRSPERLDRAFDALVRSLSGGPGRFLVLQTDSNPINRLLLFAARTAGLRSICIQHGIFQRGSPAHIVDGWMADYTLVYDPYQRSVLTEKGMAPERLPVLGFHARPVEQRMPPPASGRDRRICFMGQPWANFQAALGERYLSIVRRVFGDLRAAGLEVVFKPHPREVGRGYLRDFVPCFEGSMAEALERFDVCVSITSTALLEATIAGRVAIQVHDAAFDADRFDEAGYAHCVPVDRLDELVTCCLEAPPIDNPHLELLEPATLARRFVDVLEKLDPAAPSHRGPAPPPAARGT
jgi:hypothetical protein